MGIRTANRDVYAPALPARIARRSRPSTPAERPPQRRSEPTEDVFVKHADLVVVLQRLGGPGSLQARLEATANTKARSRRSKQAAAALPPRILAVLEQLKDGLSEKEIAAQMGLSHNTIHHYVKLIYRRLNVSSRSELMALWLKR
jgi:DNA-binding NarL/FixJ family response regulator